MTTQPIAINARPIDTAADPTTTVRVERLVDIHTVCAVTDLSRDTITRMVHAGTFPAPIRLGNGSLIRWRASDYNRWVEKVQREQAEAHRKATRER